MILDKTYLTFRSFTSNGGRISPEMTDLTVEAPLQIIVNGQPHTLVMFTPQNVRELAIGFVFTEGLINDFKDIKGCRVSAVRKEDGEEIIEAHVEITAKGALSLAASGKRVSYSSCGICGRCFRARAATSPKRRASRRSGAPTSTRKSASTN